ncbi:MAG: PAS domain S-box protein [Bacteroidales bacterium]|nr:PAS domain S-box protein [Bacteroidales bacterium]
MNSTGSNETYSQLIARIPLPLCLVDDTGRLTFINDRFTKVFGYTLDDIPTLDKWWELAYPDKVYREWVLETWNKAVEQGKTNNVDIESVDYKVTCKDGTVKTIIISGITMETGFLATFFDVTDRKTAEDGLRESEERYRTLTESAQDSIFLLNRDYKIQFVNDYAAAQFRSSKSGLLGKSIMELFPPERAQKFKKSINQVFSSGELFVSEEKIPFPGTDRWLNNSLMPVRNPQGEISQVLGISRDVTIYKQAEEDRDRFFNLNLDLLCIAGTDGFFKRLNPTWTNVLGFTEEELMAKPFFDFIHPDDIQPTLDAVNLLSAQNPVINFVNRYRCKDGSYRWLSWASTPHGDQIYAAAHDITEQHEIEQSLMASQEKLSKEIAYSDHLIDGLPGLFYQISPDGRFTRWNKNFEKVSQYSSKELAKMSPLDLFEGEDKLEIEKRIKEVFQSGISVAEANFISKKGARTPYFFSGKKIIINDQPFLIGMGLDMTDKILAEAEARKSATLMNNIMNSSTDLIFIKDKELRTILCNETFAAALGKKPSDLVGKTDIENGWNPELVKGDPEKGIRGYEADDLEALNGKKIQSVDAAGDEQDGFMYFDTVKLPLVDDQGETIGIFGISRDITKQRQIEEQIKLSEEKFRLAFDNAAIGKAMANLEGQFIKVSPAMCTMLGYDEKELLTKTWMDITHPEFLQLSFEMVEKLVKNEQPSAFYDCKFIHKDGTSLWININIVLVRNAMGVPQFFLGDMVNISVRKRITEELNYRNQIVRKFLTVSDEEMFHDVLKIVLDAMESPYGVFGYINQNGDLIVPSMTRHIWDECNVPEKDIVFKKETWGCSSWPRAIREKQSNYSNEPSDLTPEGHIKVQRHVTMPVIHHDKVIGLLQVANKESDYTQDEVDLMESLAASIAPILSARMERNQEERLRTEAEKALEGKVVELERSNKELEQFAYVASHDLQEPLRMVSSYTQLLEKRYKDRLDDDAHDFINFAVDGANRMQRLINDLLDYSRVTTRGNPFQKLDLSSIMGQVIVNLHQKIKESQAMIVNDDLPFVKGDESQLIRLFQNLIDNAIKFRGEESPRVTIKATAEDKTVTISVQDNGIGVNEIYSDRIFTIFQRLHGKDKYPGTGIGLAICKRIVERHGGSIWFTSEEGKGTTFWFTLRQ